jgi:hypothetical protein
MDRKYISFPSCVWLLVEIGGSFVGWTGWFVRRVHGGGEVSTASFAPVVNLGYFDVWQQRLESQGD